MDIENLKLLHKKHDGNLSAMARELGISRQAMHGRIKRLGIKGLNSTFQERHYRMLKTVQTKTFRKVYYKFNGNHKKISKHYQICTKTLTRYLRLSGLLDVYPPTRGNISHYGQKIMAGGSNENSKDY